MSSPLQEDRSFIYNEFVESTRALTLDFSPTNVWMSQIDSDNLDDTYDKLLDLYYDGELLVDFPQLKLIAAIAICDTADISVIDDSSIGGGLNG